MEAYSIVPEFQHFKFYPYLVILFQLIALGFMIFGHFVTSLGYILALMYGFCSFYYITLLFVGKFYRLSVNTNSMIVWSVFNKPKSYNVDKVRWKIQKIPWYNSYFILLYYMDGMPIAIIKPLWTNGLRVVKFRHLGVYSSTEIEYLKFLRKFGLLK